MYHLKGVDCMKNGNWKINIKVRFKFKIFISIIVIVIFSFIIKEIENNLILFVIICVIICFTICYNTKKNTEKVIIKDLVDLALEGERDTVHLKKDDKGFSLSTDIKEKHNNKTH